MICDHLHSGFVDYLYKKGGKLLVKGVRLLWSGGKGGRGERSVGERGEGGGGGEDNRVGGGEEETGKLELETILSSLMFQNSDGEPHVNIISEEYARFQMVMNYLQLFEVSL